MLEFIYSLMGSMDCFIVESIIVKEIKRSVEGIFRMKDILLIDWMIFGYFSSKFY